MILTSAASLLFSGIFQVLGQGSSAVAFNWWLRDSVVNNFSIVIVSDVFIALLFGIAAAVVLARLVSRWNEALLRRVSQIRHTSVERRRSQKSKPSAVGARAGAGEEQQQRSSLLIQGDSQQNYGATDEHGGASDDDDDDESSSHRSGSGSADQQRAAAAAAAAVVAAFDEVSISLHEFWHVFKGMFFFNRRAVGWLLLAGTADAVLSLCETYAAGHIAVLTQLFLKAAEPLLTWIFALKWRRFEASPTRRTAIRNLSTATGREFAFSPTVLKQQQHNNEFDDASSLHTQQTQPPSQVRARSRSPPQQQQQQQRQQQQREADNNNSDDETTTFGNLCSISTKRLALSILSLLCVAAGIALHFALDIRHEIETGKDKQNPAGFVLLYTVSIIGSSVYAIAFGRYIFLARKIAAITDPLDLVDLHRSHEHDQLTEHFASGHSVSGIGDESESAGARASMGAFSDGRQSAQQQQQDQQQHFDASDHPITFGVQRRSSLNSDGWDATESSPIRHSAAAAAAAAAGAAPDPAYASFATSSAEQHEQQQQQQQQFCDGTSSSSAAAAAVVALSRQQQYRLAEAERQQYEANNKKHAATAFDVRVVACALETTIALVISLLVAPSFEFAPGVGSARSWGELGSQTRSGLSALGSPHALLYAAVTLLGWWLVYAADSVLNHLSAPLGALISQLASPLTAVVLLIAPALDPSGNPADKLPESIGIQLTLKVLSVVMVLIGSILMYFAERLAR